MYWIVSGPDNNPLTGEVLFQQDTGFWSQAAPVFSFLCSVCSIGVALYVASRARKLTQQQRDIAEQGRQIAQDKLDMDVFERKFKIYLAYSEFFSNLTDPSITSHEDLNPYVRKYYSNKSSRIVFFEGDDLKNLTNIGKNLEAFLFFRANNVSIFEMDSETIEVFNKLKKTCLEDSKILAAIMQAHSPKNLKKPPINHLPTTSPASHPAPQPTAPEEAQ